MHDFIQNLSFSSPPPAPRAASEPLPRLTQSFNELPAYRAIPRPAKRRKSPVRSSHKS